MSKTIRGKVVVVTGGARGIGRGIACKLAEQGAHVAIIDLDKQAIGDAVSQVESLGSQAKGYRCDITDESSVEATFSGIAADFGRIDGLINNAGVIRDGLLVKVKGNNVVSRLSAADFDFVVDVCLKGAFMCAREAVAHMLLGGDEGGVIINISSGSFRGNFGQTNYSAAKAGLVAMSRVWAKEYGRHGIRSMVIAPGAIETDLLRSMPEDGLKALTNLIPLRHIGQIENIAQAALHIFENDYLTGSILEVNGGMTI
jgi:3-oxoacyl-[acyl-carrier protein] reductase